MHKQLTHSATIKNKMTCDLQTANDTVQQLQVSVVVVVQRKGNHAANV